MAVLAHCWPVFRSPLPQVLCSLSIHSISYIPAIFNPLYILLHHWKLHYLAFCFSSNPSPNNQMGVLQALIVLCLHYVALCGWLVIPAQGIGLLQGSPISPAISLTLFWLINRPWDAAGMQCTLCLKTAKTKCSGCRSEGQELWECSAKPLWFSETGFKSPPICPSFFQTFA